MVGLGIGVGCSGHGTFLCIPYSWFQQQKDMERRQFCPSKQSVNPTRAIGAQSRQIKLPKAISVQGNNQGKIKKSTPGTSWVKIMIFAPS